MVGVVNIYPCILYIAIIYDMMLLVAQPGYVTYFQHRWTSEKLWKGLSEARLKVKVVASMKQSRCTPSNVIFQFSSMPRLDRKKGIVFGWIGF
jgi:hypothetical protein